jgi:glutathione peroxidase-family protein
LKVSFLNEGIFTYYKRPLFVVLGFPILQFPQKERKKEKDYFLKKNSPTSILSFNSWPKI